MTSIVVLDMHQRYKRVQAFKGRLRRQVPKDQRDMQPEDWMYAEYENVCNDLEESLNQMRAALVSRLDSIVDTDIPLRENILKTIDSLSASDLSDSFFSMMRSGTDLSSAFQAIEISILVFCGVPLKDAYEIVKRTPTLQNVISDSGAHFLTSSMFTGPVMSHYRNFRNTLSNTIKSMLLRLQEIEIHQGLAILLQANKDSGELLPATVGELSMYVAHFASAQEASRADIDLTRSVPELS